MLVILSECRRRLVTIEFMLENLENLIWIYSMSPPWAIWVC